MASSFRLSTKSLAEASARRPWRVITIWGGIFVLALLVTGAFLSDALTTEFNFTNNPEAKVGIDLSKEKIRDIQQANEVVLIESDTYTVDDPAYREHVEELQARLVGLGGDVVQPDTFSNYYESGNRDFVSEDGRTTLVPFIMAGNYDQSNENIDKVKEVIHEFDQRAGFNTLITGNASFNSEINETSEKDLQAEFRIGLPAAIIILVLVFATLVAASIPVILAILAIVVAVGISALVGQMFQLSFFITNMITMIGLAVGIDYSLFIVSRYREERARGRSKLEAIDIAGSTASNAVLFSGLAVVLALMGMLIIPTTIFRDLALGAIFVVAVSVLAALTLLPAILSLLGDKISALRIPFISNAQVTFDEQKRGGLWDRIATAVMRRPIISFVVTAVVLIAAAVPYFGINAGFAGISTVPDSLESKQAFNILRDKFPHFGQTEPVRIVVDGDVNSPEVQGAIERLSQTLADDPSFGRTFPLETAEDGTLAMVSAPVPGDPNSDEVIDAIRRLRAEIVPQTFQGVNAEVYVTGTTAFNIDFFDITDKYFPIVLTFVLGLSFILLLLVFRSIVVPIKAILMNLLSVGAAYGLLVLVFQRGFLNEVLGFQQVDTVEAWIPLFLFSVLFGLSMDYEVFLLSRIRERFDQTQDNAEAVAYGLRTTGRLITGAALIMVGVFAGFASGELVMFQQMGFGLAVAILLDATIIRCVLVPSTMKLLGNANWYLPNWLSWLPDLRVEGPRVAEVPAVAGGSDD